MVSIRKWGWPLSWSSLGMLRCRVPLRGPFVWLLLALVLTGASSYIHGSRYAVVPGHGPFPSVAVQGAGTVPPPAEAAASPAGTSSTLVSQAVPVVQEVGPSVDPGARERDCCERRQAPSSEPAPLRTGVVDPPSLTHGRPGDGILSRVVPREPDLPAITVVKFSISRT